MFWTADILFLETHETITCLEEAAVGRAALKCFSSPFVSKWDNPDCWPEELARLWCCLQWPAANGRKAVWTVPVKSSHTGHWCQHIQEERECYTSHIAERSSASHYATYSCFCQLGLDVGKGSAQGDAMAWYGACCCHFWSHCWDKLFHIYRKKEENSRDGCD